MFASDCLRYEKSRPGSRTTFRGGFFANTYFKDMGGGSPSLKQQKRPDAHRECRRGISVILSKERGDITSLRQPKPDAPALGDIIPSPAPYHERRNRAMPAFLSAFQLEAYAQHASVIRFPLVGNPDELPALGCMGNMLAYAGAGIQRAFRRIGIPDIDDAQRVSGTFRQAGKAELLRRFFTAHLPGHHRQITGQNLIHLRADGRRVLRGKIVRKVEVHLGLVGIDMRGKTAGAAVAADEHAAQRMFRRVHPRIIFLTHEYRTPCFLLCYRKKTGRKR